MEPMEIIVLDDDDEEMAVEQEEDATSEDDYYYSLFDVLKDGHAEESDIEQFFWARNDTPLRRLELASIEDQLLQLEIIVYDMGLRTLEAVNYRQKELARLEWIWLCLANEVPEKIYVPTMSHWLNSPKAAMATQEGKPLKVDNALLIAESPLVVFRVDERIFRSPLHFRCLMRVLDYYLDAIKKANKVKLDHSCMQTGITQAEMGERFRVYSAYCGAQELVTVQLLLDICDKKSEDTDAVLDQIREIAFAQIHQMFIDNSSLAQLVHYNMYPRRLIPLVVNKVNSAHTLMLGIDKFFTFQHLQRRIFAIHLVAALVERYKLPDAFACVGLVSDMLETLISSDINEMHVTLFLVSMPALTRLIKASPFHSAPLLETLDRMQKIACSRLSIYTSKSAAIDSQEYTLMRMIDECRDDCKEDEDEEEKQEPVVNGKAPKK